MKNLFTFCTVVLFALGANAQLNNWYVGGIVGFNSSSQNYNNDYKSTNWMFGPEVGVGIGDKWSVGVILGMNGASDKNANGDISSSFMMMPDIYGRHWWNVGEKLNIFVGADVAFGFGSMTTYNTPTPGVDQETDRSAFSTNLNAGITYSLAERWSLLFKMAGVGYSSSTNSMDGPNGTVNQTDSSFWFLADGNVVDNQFLFVGLYWTFLPGGGGGGGQ